MEGRARPNLKAPVEFAAYRRELRGVARGVRWGGIGITLTGAVIAASRAWAWPAMPVLVPLVVIVWGTLLMLNAIALQTVYHVRRMRGL